MKKIVDEQSFLIAFAEKYGAHFKYIGGYPNADILIECKQCGAIKQRNRKEIFKSRENIACWHCGNNLHREKAICSHCGDTFIKQGQRQSVCNKCRAEVERNKAKIRRRLRESRATSNGKVDWNITLNKVIERDNNICRLCGGPCNKEDYYITGDGHFIAGKTYPSIDHIIPLSKGGTHQMDNIQLAHRCCNSSKFTKIIYT